MGSWVYVLLFFEVCLVSAKVKGLSRARLSFRRSLHSRGGYRSVNIRASESVPSWTELVSEAEKTSVGKRLIDEASERKEGKGSPHTDATLRLFGAKESDVRVTLYRDRAAWCPYCQKVWIMLEEKKIPYKIQHINMRSYGPKPRSFLDKVPSGLLPALELDGELYTDSITIMQLIDAKFPDNKPTFFPMERSTEIQELYNLERSLFSAWCRLLFQPPSPNPFSFMPDSRQQKFEGLLDTVNAKLNKAFDETGNSFFLGTPHPTLIDLQFVTHIERMEASCVYWKGLKLRDSKWKGLDRWLDAFEERESYRATKSDFYTHIMNIPPQYGSVYPDIENPNVREAVDFIGGGSWNLPKGYQDDFGNQRVFPASRKYMEGESWSLPVPNYNKDVWEPIRAPFQIDEEEARHEAAFKIASNAENLVKFACRGTGEKPMNYAAPLADPDARPNLEDAPDVDLLIRMATAGLLRGQVPQFDADSIPEERRKELGRCVRYLRDRVGVPRDMSFPAAQHMRAYLNILANILVPEEMQDIPWASL